MKHTHTHEAVYSSAVVSRWFNFVQGLGATSARSSTAQQDLRGGGSPVSPDRSRTDLGLCSFISGTQSFEGSCIIEQRLDEQDLGFAVLLQRTAQLRIATRATESCRDSLVRWGERPAI